MKRNRKKDKPVIPQSRGQATVIMKHERKPVWPSIVMLSVLLLVGYLIYSNTFSCSFHFDDIDSIVDNSAIRDIHNPGYIWNYWPTRFLTHLTIALNYHLHGLDVWGYHLFNLVVHLGSAILVWWLTFLTLSTPALKDQKIARHVMAISFLTGMVFVAHPIQTQGVTYIIQRAVSLTTLLYLASLSLYVKSRLLEEEGRSRIVSKCLYGLSLITAVMAMFAKEAAITLPLMICLYEFSFLMTKKSSTWKRLVPFILTLFIIPITMLLTKSVSFAGMHRIAEPGPGISSWHYLLTQFRVITTYIRLVFLPFNQNLDYDYPIAKTLLDLPTLASLFFLIGVLILAIKLFRNYRLISFGIFWFLLSLLPESSVIPIKDVIFEHRLYLPVVGYSIFLVSGIYYLFREERIKFSVLAISLLIIVYSILTYQRNQVWKNEFSLWNDVIRKSSLKARPYANRGDAYNDKGSYDQAISDYNKSIELKPDYFEAYLHRGNSYYAKGSYDQAISDYTKAIELNPGYAEAYSNRAGVYDDKGNYDQAISDYSKAIEFNPTLPQIYYNRGLVYTRKNMLDQAIADYTKAIELNPNFTQAYYSRAMIYNRYPRK
ncbi:MAG: tetratricopeptide repeat protein [Candidatus Omnitrophica bacterium]|nr:tetratricopeptide repeat protein [Candidatus Omnitrophota bacterium]